MSVCRQFKAAIANVWVLRDQKVTEVSLFSTHVVPDIMARHKAEELRDLPDAEPLLYIGKLNELSWF